MNKKRLINDGAWTASLQVIAAVGQLVGIRLLTEIMSPRDFGVLSLYLGVVALLATCIVNPTMQALLRYYQEYAMIGYGRLVRIVASKQLISMLLWITPFFLVGIILLLVYDRVSFSDFILLGALVVIEIIRLQNTALLNSARMHKEYGFWAVADAWLRPLLAFVLFKYFGASLTLVIGAFFCSSLIVWFVMKRTVPYDEDKKWNDSKFNKLKILFWRYSFPLLPLGILGWVTGMGDRYLIGIILSPADVGVYVAIYGLASRPMLMLGSIVETTFRPVYQNSVIVGDRSLATFYLKRWSLIIFIMASSAVIISLFSYDLLARIMLGEQFRYASYLFPWIVTGYAFYLFYQITGRICYAFGKTKKVLYVEMAGSIIAIVSIVFGIISLGLLGAGIAIVFYFAMQFMIGCFVVKKILLDFN